MRQNVRCFEVTGTARKRLRMDRAALRDIERMLRGGCDPAEVEAKSEEWLAVRLELFRIINRLPDRDDRLVLMAYYLLHKTVRQIAEEDGLTEDGVYYRKRAALSHLEAMLKGGDSIGFETSHED